MSDPMRDILRKVGDGMGPIEAFLDGSADGSALPPVSPSEDWWAKHPNVPDTDGHCRRCGEEWDPNNVGEHECPPGFIPLPSRIEFFAEGHEGEASTECPHKRKMPNGWYCDLASGSLRVLAKDSRELERRAVLRADLPGEPSEEAVDAFIKLYRKDLRSGHIGISPVDPNQRWHLRNWIAAAYAIDGRGTATP